MSGNQTRGLIRRARRRSRSDRGFTLLELLISLALLAMMMVIIPSTIRLASRASTTATEMVSSGDNAAALTFLRQRLTEAVPLIESDSEGKLQVAFNGDAQSLMFVTSIAHGPTGGGFYRVKLSIVREDPESPAALDLAISPNPPAGSATSPTAATDTRRIAAGLSTASLRYFGTAESGSAPEWTTAWSGRDRLPDIVELQLAPIDTRYRLASPLTVELKLRRMD